MHWWQRKLAVKGSPRGRPWTNAPLCTARWSCSVFRGGAGAALITGPTLAKLLERAVPEVAAHQSWAQYSSRPTTHSRRQGWAIKEFSVLSEMCSICEQPLYGIMLMILHTNKWCVLIIDQNLQIFLKSIWKIPSASGHSHSPFTSCRTRPSWHNGSSLGPHVLNGYGSMTLATTNTIYGKRDPALVDMWGASYQNMKYQSSLRRRVITGGSEKTVRVSRRMDCRIGVIKFYVSANN